MASTKEPKDTTKKNTEGAEGGESAPSPFADLVRKAPTATPGARAQSRAPAAVKTQAGKPSTGVRRLRRKLRRG